MNLVFYIKQQIPSTNTLRPVIPDNARPLRITAAAGTKLAGTSSLTNVIIFISERTLQPISNKIKNLLCLSSFTQHYWIRLSSIVQNSSLLAK